MAGGVDISAAGGNPPSSGGLKPLVAALDKYQQQLSAVSRALEEAAALAGTTTAGGVASTTTTIVQKAQPPSVPLPQQKADPRYNPDLDYALGIGPKPEPPAPVAAPVLPEPPAPIAAPVLPETPVAPQLQQPVLPQAPVAPQLPQPVLPETPVAAAATEEKTEAPKDESKADPISNVMDQFGEVFKGIGATLKTSLTSLSGIFNTVGVSAKLLEIAAESVAIALEPVEDVFDALSDAVRPIAEAFKVLLSVALAPIVGALKVFGSLLKLLTSILKPVIAIVNGFGMIIDAIAEVIESIGTPMEIVAIQIEMIAEVFASIFGNVATIAKSMRAPQVAIQDAFKNVKSTIADLLINPMGAIPDLMSRIREAVETFNPGAMIEFDLAMRDLMAVFGEALLPVVKIVTGVIRKFADTLRPILQKLEPVFAKLANTIGNFLLMNIDKFADTIKNLIPLLELYMNRMQQSLAFQQQKQEAATMKADPLSETLKRAATAMTPAKGMLGGAFDNRKQEVKIEWDIKIPMMKEIDALKKQGLKEDSPEIKKRMGELEALGKLQDKLFNDPLLNKRAEFLKAVPADEASKDAKYMEAKNKADVAAATLETKAKAGVKPSDLGPAMKDLADSLDGLDNEMTRMVAAQTGKGAAQGLAAAQNPAFKSIADLSRDTILKAFTATSSQAQMKEQQNKKAVDNVANLPNIILQGVQAGMKAAMDIQNGVAAPAPAAPALPAPAVAR